MTLVSGVPGDARAEKAVLGALLIDPAALERVAAIVAPSDFTRPAGKVIYEAMLALQDRGMVVDYVTVASQIERTVGFAAIGGRSTLTGLINCCPSSLHVESYARLVHEAGERPIKGAVRV